MFDDAKKLIESAQRIIVIQAENPDGDSLGSALALEEILGDMGKQVSLYCDVETPKYLRYIPGWDRVSHDFDTTADLAIIVDTTSDTLIGKALNLPGVRHFFESHPVLVIDHHTLVPSTLSFEHTLLNEKAVATGELLYFLAQDAGWAVNERAADAMFAAIQADSLGMSTQHTTVETFEAATGLVKLGASPYNIETRRREFMKKAPEILKFKGELIGRIEYFLEGNLALVHVTWQDIQQYSDQFNPSVLVLDEMRLVSGVDVAIAIKTYPDGKLTGKLRSNLPVSDVIAGFFGGGGHAYAAGFRVFESYDTVLHELIDATDKALKDAPHETV
jgi:phosphoesterase RecJ-like protein